MRTDCEAVCFHQNLGFSERQNTFELSKTLLLSLAVSEWLECEHCVSGPWKDDVEMMTTPLVLKLDFPPAAELLSRNNLILEKLQDGNIQSGLHGPDKPFRSHPGSLRVSDLGRSQAQG